jgi:hypothetical protein
VTIFEEKIYYQPEKYSSSSIKCGINRNNCPRLVNTGQGINSSHYSGRSLP